jgi:hypothetical protein
MRKFCRLVAICVLPISLAIAQTVTVKRNVVLRSKASSTSTAITSLKPPATLTLINPAARNGFLRVTTDDGDKGWVYAKNVEVSDDEDAGEGSAPIEDDTIAKLLAAHVDAVGQSLVIWARDTCREKMQAQKAPRELPTSR